MFEREFFKSRKILLTGHTGFKGNLDVAYA